MSQQPGRRAAFGAALVGVLLAVASTLGLGLAPAASAAPAHDVTSISADASISAATSYAHPALPRAAHGASARTAGADRALAGHASAVVGAAFPLLALAALGIAAAAWCRRSSSPTRRAAGPRAPPTLVAC